jgi:branched-chain amino acid transport system substrate-binding protein
MNKRTLLIIIALVAVVAAAFGIYKYRGGTGESRTPITVSVSLPLTGPIANSGKLFQDAVTLAQEDLKKGTPPQSVAFEWNDNAGAPAQAATVAQRQASSDASLFFVGYTAETLAVQPVLSGTGKPIFAFSFLATITKDPLIYRNSISYKLEYPILVEYAKKRQAKKIAVIFVDLPESHEEFKQFVIPELVRSGWSETDISLFPYAITESDFRTVVTKVAQTSPDLIMINGFASSLAPLIQALRSYGLVKDGNVIGDFNTVDVPRLSSNEAVEGIAAAAPSYLVRPSQKAADFQARYQARFGRPPSYSGFTGYDMALIAADLARRLPERPTPQQINEELKKTDIEGVTGRITFDAEGDVLTLAEPIIFRGGKLTPVRTP